MAEAGKARIIDGKAVAGTVIDTVKKGREALLAAGADNPGLAVVIVGEDPASKVYVRNKGLKAEECGFRSDTHRLPAETSEEDLLALIAELNADPLIHGILAQLPLPAHISERAVINAIDPAKDVDGLSPVNLGRLVSGARAEALVSCTPAGCLVMAKSALGENLSGLEAVVVGRSNIVGKPVAHLLLAENCTVTIAHSRTRDLPDVCRRADILLAAVGRPQMITGDWVKPGATIIDVGINRIPAPERGEGKTRLVGDVDFDSAVEVAGAITPVPGGVGLMTIAMLMANTLTAAARAAGRPDIAEAALA
ncbi:bifunctional methylenetetrahydrofolate dehydrogenase/methenyltetrahydrofolate cyclohydrolase FolD [Afifella pfennigii]|uniref:bifunctional methylenetetrahydrofolate dehydrogenase/methenyltetrahydrofolate cyclohydrolase FolD n=1 Tax=Afifella pfennigii TaxID=209897 RepID=UPI0005542E28|nr:bifunctional methylenetetrahydrofolate dehydrogenase/methenyltetrahydrofolate cyclohydrolase FolD [Afifella pfennigii]